MTDIEAVLAAARQRAEALVASDPGGLRRLMHPDLRWTTFNGDVLDRGRYIEGNTNGTLAWRAQRLDDVDVVVVQDVAILTAVVVDDVERGGERSEYRLRLTQTWLRTSDGWQCISGHAGPRLPPT